jgi:hypothetical protein
VVPSFVHSVGYSVHTSKHTINTSAHNFTGRARGEVIR